MTLPRLGSKQPINTSKMDAKENKRPYTPENPSFENPCNGTKKPKKAHHIVEYECIICTKTLKHPGEPHGICIVSRCGHDLQSIFESVLSVAVQNLLSPFEFMEQERENKCSMNMLILNGHLTSG
uniref:Zf-LSD1 domain-containing protein n=1 Tax=Rhabditophanes sp. KR3021 TaxID=114890 RepID=A0AC35U228_9BILA